MGSNQENIPIIITIRELDHGMVNVAWMYASTVMYVYLNEDNNRVGLSSESQSFLKSSLVRDPREISEPDSEAKRRALPGHVPDPAKKSCLLEYHNLQSFVFAFL